MKKYKILKILLDEFSKKSVKDFSGISPAKFLKDSIKEFRRQIIDDFLGEISGRKKKYRNLIVIHAKSSLRTIEGTSAGTPGRFLEDFQKAKYP